MTEPGNGGLRTVVITGSTRGIGYGLADAFLAHGCQVVVSGRAPPRVTAAVDRLAINHHRERIRGQPCDVTDYQQVQSLWEGALKHFGRVDIWINNAGRAHPRLPVANLSSELARQVVETNLIGVLNGSRVALVGMREQGFGALYNMEGLGSTGRKVPGLAVYGATKRAVTYLTEALVRECRDTPLIVGSLRPGMVVTDLLMGNLDRKSPDWPRARRMINILTDRVETVTPWLARQILANRKSGATISWLTGRKVLWRLLTAPFTNRDVLDG